MSDAKESTQFTLQKSISNLLNNSYNYRRVKLDKRTRIKKFINYLRIGQQMGVALRLSAICYPTLHVWKKKSHFDRLAKLIGIAQDIGQQIRNDMVEDAQFQRLVTGVANGSEYEFYLTNRRTERWKKTTEFGSGQGAPVLLKPPVINYISVSVSTKEPIDVKVENKPEEEVGRIGTNV